MLRGARRLVALRWLGAGRVALGGLERLRASGWPHHSDAHPAAITPGPGPLLAYLDSVTCHVFHMTDATMGARCDHGPAILLQMAAMHFLLMASASAFIAPPGRPLHAWHPLQTQPRLPATAVPLRSLYALHMQVRACQF